MSDEEELFAARQSKLRPIFITILPLLGSYCLAWVFSKFTGIAFLPVFILFCGIGAVAFLKDAPVQAMQNRPRRRKLTQAEQDALRARRFYVGQDETDSQKEAKIVAASAEKDMTQPKSIMDKDSLQKKRNLDKEKTPDGSKSMRQSPERQAKALNPERKLAIKPDDI